MRRINAPADRLIGIVSAYFCIQNIAASQARTAAPRKRRPLAALGRSRQSSLSGCACSQICGQLIAGSLDRGWTALSVRHGSTRISYVWTLARAK
jgi:hypothetical protein